MSYEIKPGKNDGYEVHIDGRYAQWCATKREAHAFGRAHSPSTGKQTRKSKLSARAVMRGSSSKTRTSKKGQTAKSTKSRTLEARIVQRLSSGGPATAASLAKGLGTTRTAVNRRLYGVLSDKGLVSRNDDFVWSTTTAPAKKRWSGKGWATVQNQAGSGTDTARSNCGCSSWKRHWEKKFAWPKVCAERSCRQPPEDGAHVVRLTGGDGAYIVPLCKKHNHPSRDGSFQVKTAQLKIHNRKYASCSKSS